MSLRIKTLDLHPHEGCVVKGLEMLATFDGVPDMSGVRRTLLPGSDPDTQRECVHAMVDRVFDVALEGADMLVVCPEARRCQKKAPTCHHGTVHPKGVQPTPCKKCVPLGKEAPA